MRPGPPYVTGQRLQLVDAAPDNWNRADGTAFQIGDLFLPHGTLQGQRFVTPGQDWCVSLTYLAQHAARRAPLVVILPCLTPFCLDGVPLRAGHVMLDEAGWTVTGEIPSLTVTPSINVGGGWHGHIAAGVIGPHC